MKRFNINLPDELYKKLRQEAFDKEISISGWILQLLDKGMLMGDDAFKELNVELYTKPFSGRHEKGFPKANITPTPEISIGDPQPPVYTTTSNGTGRKAKSTGGLCEHGSMPSLCKYSKCRK